MARHPLDPIVWLAGVGWDDLPGTDKRMARELAKTRPVVWIDSPRRGVWKGWWRRQYPAVETVEPGITRLRAPGPPGFSRWPVRPLTAFLQRCTLVRNLGGCTPHAVVVANPLARFHPGISAPKVLYVTDDWVAGAALIGYSQAVLRRSLTANVEIADAVAAVTPALLDSLNHHNLAPHTPRMVLPNGAPTVKQYPDRIREPVAGVVGQLNERLDLTALEAVVAAGVRLRFIGPRTDSAPDFARRLDTLLARPGVEWIGALGTDQLAAELACLRVGLTPYADTPFNRSSFPLKSLEYLAAGIPVVSTDLSASRWLESRHVRVADSAEAFAAAVLSIVDSEMDSADMAERIALAESHGWPRRAAQLLDFIDQLPRRAPQQQGSGRCEP